MSSGSDTSSASAPCAAAAAAAPRSHTAPCSLSVPAGLAVHLSRVDVAAPLNPFRCDFEGVLSKLCRQVHPLMQVLSLHPRNYSYVALAAYRLLRHLIPPTDAVARAAKQNVSAAPPSSPASPDVALAAMRACVCLVLTAELSKHALLECDRALRAVPAAYEAVFTVDALVRPLLAVDAATDETELSAWQRWLTASPAWQTLAGCVAEYVVAELMELLGNYLRNNLWMRSPIACLHEKVLRKDRELAALWGTIGMPDKYPPELDTDMQAVYQQQFEQQMRAAVAESAPWMLDEQQVQQRVAAWMDGPLLSGDAVFFRRYHIRPLWHTGWDVSDLESSLAKAAHAIASHDHGDDLEPGESWTSGSSMSLEAGVDIVDAANVARRLVIRCCVSIDSCNSVQRCMEVTVEGGGEWRGHLIGSRYEEDEHRAGVPPYALTKLTVTNAAIVPGAQPDEPFSDYVCHGHLHGLSERQWHEAMGGRLRVDYYSGDSSVTQQERADDEQAAVFKETMFPARLVDMVDEPQYRRLQSTEIRRMAAIASRLVMLDAGVDVAAFPCFQPVQMRRQFELAMQTRLETEVAGLPAPLPSDVQGLVREYYAPHVDIPL